MCCFITAGEGEGVCPEAKTKHTYRLQSNRAANISNKCTVMDGDDTLKKAPLLMLYLKSPIHIVL